MPIALEEYTRLGQYDHQSERIQELEESHWTLSHFDKHLVKAEGKLSYRPEE